MSKSDFHCHEGTDLKYRSTGHLSILSKDSSPPPHPFPGYRINNISAPRAPFAHLIIQLLQMLSRTHFLADLEELDPHLPRDTIVRFELLTRVEDHGFDVVRRDTICDDDDVQGFDMCFYPAGKFPLERICAAREVRFQYSVQASSCGGATSRCDLTEDFIDSCSGFNVLEKRTVGCV